MKNLILTIGFILTTLTSLTQIQLCLGDDTTICTPQAVTITNCNTGNSNVAGLYLNNPTSLSLTDDVWSNTVNIGFPFTFYGISYNQCVVGSNGLISFNTSNANGYCPWGLNGIPPLPTPALPSAANSIMLTYQDINPALGGQVQYQTIGTAPNRKFVVIYKDIYMFSCTQQCNYMSIVLYETTNVFELHIGNKPICNTWNGGLAIQGSENNPMTIAHITPGRNNTVWGANQDGRRFTPTSATNYTMTQIPYVQVTSPGSTLAWQNTLGQQFPYNNGVLNVPNVPPGNTGYFLVGTTCGTSIGSITTDTTWITRINATYTSTSTIVNCAGDSTGTATANMVPPFGTVTYQWNDYLLQTTQTATNLPAGTYTCIVTSSLGCNGTTNVVVNEVPQINFQNIILSNVTCDENDGSIIMVGNGGTQPYTYLIDNVVSNDTINGLSGGDYLLSIQDVNGCQVDSNVYLTYPTPITPSISPIDTVQCIPGNFTFVNTSSPSINMVSTFVMFGDNTDTTTLLTDNITHTYDSVGIWDITMSVTSDYGCVYTQTFDDIVETRPLPTAQFNIAPNPTTFFETTVLMQDQSYSNIVDWYWYSPNGSPITSTYDSPTFSFPEGVTGQYPIYLTVTDNLGCSDTTSRILIVNSDVLSFIPNTFTPDDNEYNQSWGFNFAGIDDQRFNLYVFNRWGEMIWECHNPNETWDGTYNGFPVQQGMYAWKADFGVVNTDERRSINGFVNVIR